MLRPEDGASVEETSTVLDIVEVVLFWYAAKAVSGGDTELPVPIRLLEDCETKDVVLFWYTELETVLALDTRAVETVDTTLEFAALLADCTEVG